MNSIRSGAPPRRSAKNLSLTSLNWRGLPLIRSCFDQYGDRKHFLTTFASAICRDSGLSVPPTWLSDLGSREWWRSRVTRGETGVHIDETDEKLGYEGEIGRRRRLVQRTLNRLRDPRSWGWSRRQLGSQENANESIVSDEVKASDNDNTVKVEAAESSFDGPSLSHRSSSGREELSTEKAANMTPPQLTGSPRCASRPYALSSWTQKEPSRALRGCYTSTTTVAAVVPPETLSASTCAAYLNAPDLGHRDHCRLDKTRILDELERNPALTLATAREITLGALRRFDRLKASEEACKNFTRSFSLILGNDSGITFDDDTQVYTTIYQRYWDHVDDGRLPAMRISDWDESNAVFILQAITDATRRKREADLHGRTDWPMVDGEDIPGRAVTSEQSLVSAQPVPSIVDTPARPSIVNTPSRLSGINSPRTTRRDGSKAAGESSVACTQRKSAERKLVIDAGETKSSQTPTSDVLVSRDSPETTRSNDAGTWGASTTCLTAIAAVAATYAAYRGVSSLSSSLRE